MKTEDIAAKPPSPWVPETDLMVLAHLGKLGEEASELSAHLFRIVIQGQHGDDPETGQPNMEKLEDELADVLANAERAIYYLSLDRRRIAQRMERKNTYLAAWISMLHPIYLGEEEA